MATPEPSPQRFCLRVCYRLLLALPQVVLFVEHLMQQAGHLHASSPSTPPPMQGTAAGSSAGSAAGGAESFAAAGATSRSATGAPLQPGAAHQAWYQLGVRLALREGGCCASRAAYVGACLGAWLGGAGATPQPWLERYQLKGELQQTLPLLCRSRGGDWP